MNDNMNDHLTVENIVILLSFSLIIIVSLAGNLLVVRCLFAQSRLRNNSTNALIGMLAISDLLMTTFNIPFTVVDIILKDWIFGQFFCTLVAFVQANSVYVSSFTMAVIAINRWRIVYRFRPRSSSLAQQNIRLPVTANGNTTQRLLVGNKQSLSCYCCWWKKSAPISQTVEIEMACHPQQQSNQQSQQQSHQQSQQQQQQQQQQHQPTSGSGMKLSPGKSLILVIFTIWLLAAAHSLPHTVFNKIVKLHVETGNSSRTARRCRPVLPKLLGNNIELPLTIFTAVTQYFIPLSMAMAIYTRIGATILRQGKIGEMTQGRVEQMSKKKRRRILMLVLIVTIFALCWLPFNVYYLLLDFGVSRQNNTIFMVCLWLATSSVCYNPFVYCWFNEHFQREAKLVGQRIKSCFGFA